MTEKIKKAIQEKRKIEIKYLDLDFYVIVDPYMYGDDLFQESFVWGWIEHDGTCYKFYLDKIKDIVVTKETFEIQKGAEYYYSAEEDHFEFHDEIPNYVTWKGDKSK